jgi:hypothetical protein
MVTWSHWFRLQVRLNIMAWWNRAAHLVLARKQRETQGGAGNKLDPSKAHSQWPASLTRPYLLTVLPPLIKVIKLRIHQLISPLINWEPSWANHFPTASPLNTASLETKPSTHKLFGDTLHTQTITHIQK